MINAIVEKRFNDVTNNLKHYEPGDKIKDMTISRFNELKAKGYVKEDKEITKERKQKNKSEEETTE